MAKTFAESGGSVEDAEKALAASMQSAQKVKDLPQRAEAVSAVAGSQVEVFTQDARTKAASGDWRGADKSFSKALAAAGDITNKAELATTKGAVAKMRADTGDYGERLLPLVRAKMAARSLAAV